MNGKLFQARRCVFPLIFFLMKWLLGARYEARWIFGVRWNGYSHDLSRYFYGNHSIKVSVIHDIFQKAEAVFCLLFGSKCLKILKSSTVECRHILFIKSIGV